MPRFGIASLRERQTLHPDLQRLVDEAIKIIDFSIIEGHRGETAQNAAYARGTSKVKWPYGKHNREPSLAMDIAPFPIDWSDDRKAIERFVFLQGVIYATAKRLNIKIRLGLDWNMNLDMRDEFGLRDYPHVELVLL